MTLISEKTEFEKRYGFKQSDFNFSNPISFVKSIASKCGLKKDEIEALTETIWIWEDGRINPNAKLYTAEEVRDIALQVSKDAINGALFNLDKYLTK